MGWVSFKVRVEVEADGGCRGVERGARPKVERAVASLVVF